MDLKKEYHEISVRPEDIEKTTFNTNYDQYEFLVLPMGLCNEPSFFHSLINSIFYDCINDIAVLYIEYLWVYSRSQEDDLGHLRTVLESQRDH